MKASRNWFEPSWLGKWDPHFSGNHSDGAPVSCWLSYEITKMGAPPNSDTRKSVLAAEKAAKLQDAQASCEEDIGVVAREQTERQRLP